MPCCAHPSAGNLGSLRESKVSALMFNEARRDFIHKLATNRRNVPICNQCEFGPPEAPGMSFAQLDEAKIQQSDDQVRVIDVSG